MERPNIILIITDQQRYDTIRALGYPYMNTPNLDRLVHEGVSFTNNFVTAASCAPARASLFTGYYPHTTGIFKNADLWRRSWVERLNESGYHCVNIGKMHTFPFETPLGFHERFVVENKDRYLEGRYFFDRWDMALQARGLKKQQRELYRKRGDYGERLGAFEWELPEHTHSDFFVGDLTTWWLDNKPKTAPLFLQIGFPGPHPPYDPVPGYIDQYMAADIPLPDTTSEQINNLSSVQRELIEHNTGIDHDSIAWKKTPTREQLKRLRAYYFANVTMIDEKIGRIMDSLKQNGYLENSVIIFTSDHGDCLGDYGHIQKWTMYDIITRTPLIVWGPRYFSGGRRRDELCQQFDIAPVIFELAGLEPDQSWEAQSLMPLLQPRDGSTDKEGPAGAASSAAGGRRYVFAEQAKDGILTGTEMLTMVRERDWKLVHYAEGEEGELYDLVADPQEMQNLWWSGKDEHRLKKEELLQVLLQWHIQSSKKTGGWKAPWR